MAPVWVDICNRFDLSHIARIEVVTSHVGCRAQAWHIDGVHGITVIFALTDIGLRQGPTEIDMRIPFLGLREGTGKVKMEEYTHGFPATHPIRACMLSGSVLMFNANVSHRGGANIGSRDRPILVVDTSLESACLPVGSVDVWSV